MIPKSAYDPFALIERAVAAVLRDQGLERPAFWAPGDQMVFPPVSFTFTAPPEVQHHLLSEQG